MKVLIFNQFVPLTVFSARKMRVRHNYSRYILDDGMLTFGCYRHHACSTYDMVGRYGL